MTTQVPAGNIFGSDLGLRATGRMKIVVSSRLLGNRGNLIESGRGTVLRRSGTRLRGQAAVANQLDPEGGLLATRWEIDCNFVIPHPLLFNPTPEWTKLNDGPLTLVSNPRFQFDWNYQAQERRGMAPAARLRSQSARTPGRGNNIEILHRVVNSPAKRSGATLTVVNALWLQFGLTIPNCRRAGSGYEFSRGNTVQHYVNLLLKFSLICQSG